MGLIAIGPHYQALRQLTPKIFPVAVEEIVSPTRTPDAWWKGEENAQDSINGNHGTYEGAYDAGFVNRCFKITAADSDKQIAVPYSSLIDFRQDMPFEVEFYLKVQLHETLHRNYFDIYFGSLDFYVTMDKEDFPNEFYIWFFGSTGDHGYTIPWTTWPEGTWAKINFLFDAGVIKLLINDVEITPSDPAEITVDESEVGIDTDIDGANSGITWIDEIILFKDAVPSGPTLISHWPGEDAPTDIISGHDMLGADDDMHPTPVSIAPHYVDGVVGKAFDFHLFKVRGVTPPTLDLCIQHDSEFIIEGYFKVGADEGDATISHWCTPFTTDPENPNFINSFQCYPVAGGFSLQVYNDSGDKYLFFAYSDHDAWTPDVAFHLRLMYNNGVWKCYANTVEVPVQLGDGGDDNPAPVRDDTPTAQWFFAQFSDEINFSKVI